jgi:hypothetical protein
MECRRHAHACPIDSVEDPRGVTAHSARRQEIHCSADRADFNALSPLAREASGILGTTDFESSCVALRDASRLIRAYAPDRPDLAARLVEDANGLREVLVRAIANNHPAWLGQITDDQYRV